MLSGQNNISLRTAMKKLNLLLKKNPDNTTQKNRKLIRTIRDRLLCARHTELDKSRAGGVSHKPNVAAARSRMNEACKIADGGNISFVLSERAPSFSCVKRAVIAHAMRSLQNSLAIRKLGLRCNEPRGVSTPKRIGSETQSLKSFLFSEWRDHLILSL